MRSILRWLTRSLCLLALVTVLAAWVTSYFAAVSLGSSKMGRVRARGVVQGSFFMTEIDKTAWGDVPLQLDVQRGARANDWLSNSSMRLGFYAGAWKKRHDSFQIVFPIWLPTLLLVGLNWFVWRKAFRRAPRGAFPIEPTNKAEG